MHPKILKFLMSWSTDNLQPSMSMGLDKENQPFIIFHWYKAEKRVSLYFYDDDSIDLIKSWGANLDSSCSLTTVEELDNALTWLNQ